MASGEELYLSIIPSEYRKNKSEILSSQAEILNILKKIYNLKVLSKQKNDLKKELYKLSSSIILEISNLQEKMPTPKIPKSLKREEPIKKEKTPEFLKHDDIDDELRAIKEKLLEINN